MTTAWWRDEADLRGWDAGLGWLHGVAHAADTLRAFGRSPRLGAAHLRPPGCGATADRATGGRL
jgi:hypothetical protein